MFSHLIVVHIVPGPNSLQNGCKKVQNFLCAASGIAKTAFSIASACRARGLVGAQISSTIVESHVFSVTNKHKTGRKSQQVPKKSAFADLNAIQCRSSEWARSTEVDVTAVTVM